MVDRKTLLAALPPFSNKSVIIEDNQNVEDIMNEVAETHYLFSGDYDRIYKYFDTHNTGNSCRLLFDFCKKYIPYKIESEEDQTSRSPSAILTLGSGDCKHYAAFIGGVLSAISRNSKRTIKWCYRYAGYDILSDVPGHVFVVVNPGTDNEIWIDPVLETFNKRLQPVFYIDDKITDSMLSRVSGVSDVDSMQAFLNQPGIAEALQGIDTSVDVPEDLRLAITVLMDAGVMNELGQVDPELLGTKATTAANGGDIIEAAQIIEAYGQKNSLGNWFSDAFKFVQHAAAGMGMQVPRAAFLVLVNFNAFGYATKLNKALQYQDSRDKLWDLWERVGGKGSTLFDTIEKGATKKAMLKGVGYSKQAVNGDSVGELTAAVASAIASAAIIVAAIMPVISKLLNKHGVDTTDPNIDPNTGMPYGYNQSGGIMTWLQNNPVLVVAGIGVAALFLMPSGKKRKRRRA